MKPMRSKISLTWREELPYGISDFKDQAAARYLNNIPNPLLLGDKIQCCIEGCEHWLRRRQRGKNPEFCPRHGISISTSPTYIFQEHSRNFIVGDVLLNRLQKVESWRLGNETSEDALSWNVFVGLFVLKGLAEAFQKLTGIKPLSHPELFLWGNRIDGQCAPWKELCRVRNELENGLAIPTEPDVILRVPGQAIVLVEAKFGSQNGTFKRKEIRFGSIENYLRRYICKPRMPDPLNRDWIVEQSAENILEQLCRNVIFAQRLAEKNEQPFVINLVREQAVNDEENFRRHLSKSEITFYRRTWEDLYNLPVISTEPASNLRRYLKNKSLKLSPAFHT